MIELVKDKNLPTSIKIEDVNKWYSNIKKILIDVLNIDNDTISNFEKDKIELYFTNTVSLQMHVQYGTTKAKDAAEEILDLWKTTQRTRLMLKSIHNFNDYLKYRKQLFIALKNDNPEHDNVEFEINKIYSEVLFDEYIKGEFFSTNKIFIFNQMIKDNKLITYELTFCHLVFSLFCYNYYKYNDKLSSKDKNVASIEYEIRDDYTAQVVKNSITGYLVKRYCEINSINNNEEISSWNNHSLIIYPHSGPKYISSDSKLIKLFDISYVNMDDALIELLDSKHHSINQYEYIGVKNHNPRHIKAIK